MPDVARNEHATGFGRFGRGSSTSSVSSSQARSEAANSWHAMPPLPVAHDLPPPLPATSRTLGEAPGLPSGRQPRTHARNTSWSSTDQPASGAATRQFYQHGNYTVGNVSASHAAAPSPVPAPAQLDRRARMDRLYGGAKAAGASNSSSENSSPVASPFRPLNSGSIATASAPTSLGSSPTTSSPLTAGSAGPEFVNPARRWASSGHTKMASTGTGPHDFITNGGRGGSTGSVPIPSAPPSASATRMQSPSNQGPIYNQKSHSASYTNLPMTRNGPSALNPVRDSHSSSNTSAPSIPPQHPGRAHGGSFSSLKSSSFGIRRGSGPSALAPLKTGFADPLLGLEAPPTAFSEPTSPRVESPTAASSSHTSPETSPNRKTAAKPLPKSRSSKNLMRSLGSAKNSRSDSPSIMSRISSRISSGFGSPGRGSSLGSRISSRISSGFGSPSTSSMGMRTTSDLKSGTPAIMDLVLDDDEWPEYTPRRLPSTQVADQLVVLGDAGVSLTDVDESAKLAPQQTSSLPLREQDQAEARGFAPRGLFFYSEHAGTTDEEGNYHHVQGEQIGFRYSVVDELGKGTFGTVLRCRDHKSGRMVAVKVTASRKELQSQVKIEANLLRALLVEHRGHPESDHFVRYVEHFRFRGHMCIATELLGPNLYQLLKRNGHEGLEEPTVRYITRQLSEGLEFLASKKIIHCDIKPENILVSDVAQCQVKIVDFGSGCYEGNRLYTYIQSRFYRSPEILLGMPYTSAIDMWSLGAIVPELLLGRPLFPSVDEPDQIALMCQILGSPPPEVLWRSSRAPVFFDPMCRPLKLENSKGTMRRLPGSTPLRMLLQNFSDEAIDYCERALQWAPEARLRSDKAAFHPFVLGY